MKKFSHLEKSLRTPRPESNFATFSYLFSEYLQNLKRKYDYQQGQEKIEQLGEQVGVRLYELICLRERPKRETKLIEQLKFFQQVFWKALFGKQADSLERLKDRPQDYLIRDENPLLLKYVSEEGGLSAACYIVGILKGAFNSSGFPCKVSYQFKQDEKGMSQYPHTVFILSFDEQ